MTENDCPKAWTNRILVLNVAHGVPGDGIFLVPPKNDAFYPRMSGNMEKKIDRLKNAVSRKFLGSGWGNTHPSKTVTFEKKKKLSPARCVLFVFRGTHTSLSNTYLGAGRSLEFSSQIDYILYVHDRSMCALLCKSRGLTIHAKKLATGMPTRSPFVLQQE